MHSMDKGLSALDYCLFDQYIDAGFAFDDDSAHQSGSDEFGNFFDFADSLSGTDQTASPLQSALHFGSSTKATLSEPDLLNLDDLFPCPTHAFGHFTTPIPSSPTSPPPKRNSRETTVQFRRSASCGIRKHSRHYSLSPKMAQPISARRGRQQQAWAERFETSTQSFSFPASHPHLTSTPATHPDHDHTSYNPQSSSGAVGWSTPLEHSQDSHQPYAQQMIFHSTPLASPTIAHGHTQSIPSVHSPSTGYYSNPLSPAELAYGVDHTAVWDYEQGAEAIFGSPVFNHSLVQPWQPPSNSTQSYNHGYAEYQLTAGHVPGTERAALMQAHGLPTYEGSSESYSISATLPEYGRLKSMDCGSERRRTKSHARASRSPSPAPTPSRTQKSSRGHGRGKASQSSGRPEPGKFVNYTADDKKKILSGVAPSGSSKTKKRRAEEAQKMKERDAREWARRVREAQAGGQRLPKGGEREDDDEDDEDEGEEEVYLYHP